MTLSRPLRMIAITAVIASVVALPAPARSQQTGGLQLRDGLWAGESVAFADLSGSVEGTSATLNGTVNSQFTMFVDDAGTVDGDWILDGSAFMLFQGSVSGTMTQVYTGEGPLTGNRASVTMAGDVSTNSTATMNGQSISLQGVPSTFSIDIALTEADCTTLSGDWVFPLEQLAAQGDWTGIDIDGFFYAEYVGEDVDDEIVARIDQLWDDQAAWGDALLAGTGDVSAIWDLYTRALTLSAELADAEPCIYERTGDPSDYLARFSLGLGVRLYIALKARPFGGVELHEASIASAALGNDPSVIDPVREAVHDQAQRIMDENLTADGDTCDPCLVTGDSEDVVAAALSGAEFGQSYEIDGFTYTPARIVQAAGVYEQATNP